MALVLTAAPAAEPVSLAEAKAHLRIDADDEDALLAALIAAARIFVEKTLGLALITQGWSDYLDFWARSSCVTLPIAPVQAVEAVTLRDVNGDATDLAASDYAVDVLSLPARLVLKGGSPSVIARELNAFEIAFTAGYGDAASDVPAPIRHALLLLVAHWYERREPVVLGLGSAEVPITIAGLLLPYRRVKL
jgi:uncharacterized phiE125 gp8 family phage protein